MLQVNIYHTETIFVNSRQCPKDQQPTLVQWKPKFSLLRNQNAEFINLLCFRKKHIILSTPKLKHIFNQICLLASKHLTRFVCSISSSGRLFKPKSRLNGQRPTLFKVIYTAPNPSPLMRLNAPNDPIPPVNVTMETILNGLKLRENMLVHLSVNI